MTKTVLIIKKNIVIFVIKILIETDSIVLPSTVLKETINRSMHAFDYYSHKRKTKITLIILLEK